jgi:molybdate transport system substrate-binding protein
MRRRVLPVLASLALCAAPHPVRAQEAVTVFAAASLTDALRTLGQEWQARGHPAPRFSFAASSALARQIEQGAPADLSWRPMRPGPTTSRRATCW